MGRKVVLEVFGSPKKCLKEIGHFYRIKKPIYFSIDRLRAYTEFVCNVINCEPSGEQREKIDLALLKYLMSHGLRHPIKLCYWIG